MNQERDDEIVESFQKLGIKERKIEVHSKSRYPDEVWGTIFKNYPKREIELRATGPKKEGAVRIICISDTHNKQKFMTETFNDIEADILIHGGDFTMYGDLKEVQEFDNFLASFTKVKHKVVIAGNHEYSFDKRIETKDSDKAKSLLKNCIYLEDSGVELFGIKIYGSPWQPLHCSNAFQLKRGQPLLDKWNLIPKDTDILITHGPPLGYGDVIHGIEHVGCVELLSTVHLRVKPKYHIFGHIHEDYGAWVGCNGTVFINASTCASGYRPRNPPVIFDYELKN